MKRMMKVLANVFAGLALIETSTASMFFFHQPEMPKKTK
ncbi:cyclic lactone autoinducer peptide [Tepidibacillus marianensis]